LKANSSSDRAPGSARLAAPGTAASVVATSGSTACGVAPLNRRASSLVKNTLHRFDSV
jgi:hypothetical protein